MTDFSPLDTFRDTGGAPNPARSTRIRDEFLARIATMAPDDEGRRPFDPPRAPSTHSWIRPRQPVLALVALALVLVLAGAGALVLSPSQRSDSLDDLALAAASRSDTALDDSQYLFVSERTTAHGNTSQRNQWTASNGTGQAATAALSIRPASDPPTMTEYPTPGSLDFAGLSYAELRALPTEPSALLDELDRHGVVNSGRPGAQALALARLLALEVTPPAVGEAAIEALGQLGGTAIGAVPDRGRPRRRGHSRRQRRWDGLAGRDGPDVGFGDGGPRHRRPHEAGHRGARTGLAHPERHQLAPVLTTRRPDPSAQVARPAAHRPGDHLNVRE